ncbi:hypothetical protein [Treponema sp. Marseille-Q3903]|uniref:hypothetical protein n=1 Tax=Treponema sp. Marseille-Q3903 TaxID=2766703 RepID=UPI0016522617|nr:hypothetical protein [Treponema sp. Marseille-Q3903]MBC6713915.1 hypothetical protein [Treponema sp. Marseille-Q3903]
MIYIELFFIVGYFITPMDSTVAVITGGSSGIENAIAQECLKKRIQGRHRSSMERFAQKN